jgi:hypothetical protein
MNRIVNKFYVLSFFSVSLFHLLYLCIKVLKESKEQATVKEKTVNGIEE